MTPTEAIAERIPQARPMDEHNEQLVRNVHPPDWVNPRPPGRYNMVVGGAETAGLVTAAGAVGSLALGFNVSVGGERCHA